MTPFEEALIAIGDLEVTRRALLRKIMELEERIRQLEAEKEN